MFFFLDKFFGFKHANGADSGPVDGSISQRSMHISLRACIMAWDLCKLASCVPGIQMVLNLCPLCSPAQRRKREKERRAFVTAESHKVSKSKSAWLLFLS